MEYPLNATKYPQYVKKRAEKGDVKAMAEYGVFLFYGKPVKKNLKEAARYFKMVNYAMILREENGIEQNYAESASYF